MSFSLVVGTNTYVTRAEASSQLDQSFVGAATWDALSGESKDRALVEAFGLVERQRYKGTRTGGAGQAASFPRDGIASADGYDESGTVPAAVKKAQVLLALAIVQDSTVATSPGTGKNVRSAGAGSARVEFFRPGVGADGGPATRFPTPVQELLRPYLLAGASGLGALSFGTGACDPGEDFGLSGGL